MNLSPGTHPSNRNFLQSDTHRKHHRWPLGPYTGLRWCSPTFAKGVVSDSSCRSNPVRISHRPPPVLTVKFLIKDMLTATGHPAALQRKLWKSPLHAQQQQRPRPASSAAGYTFFSLHNSNGNPRVPATLSNLNWIIKSSSSNTVRVFELFL